jgi:hypothetical protein
MPTKTTTSTATVTTAETTIRHRFPRPGAVGPWLAADPSEHAGGSLHDWLGRAFGRGHWTRND